MDLVFYYVELMDRLDKFQRFNKFNEFKKFVAEENLTSDASVGVFTNR